jgi:acetyl-CoA C-acetyltransferase
MREVVILSAVRTPVGRLQGSLARVGAIRLGSIAVQAACERAGIEGGAVEEVIMGNVVSAGLGQNPARQAAMGAGLPPAAAALTINKVCGSGLKAVGLAAQAIQTGQARVIIAGGMESMSQAPYLLTRLRDGYRLGHGRILDSMIHDGLWDAYADYHMGCTGEIVADRWGISRAQQDEFALGSHRKAISAIREGRFREEIIGVPIAARGGEPSLFSVDECPRSDTSIEALSALPPVFREGGTITAGNAPGVNDGAAAVVVADADYARESGIPPLARIRDQAVSGIEPALAMMAPVEAVRKLLGKLGWTIGDVDLIELNEAFSAQALAVIRELGLDPDRVNLNGGAVALGHPIGASGARILVTLLHQMRRLQVRRGIATLCLGGGNAVALALETE